MCKCCEQGEVIKTKVVAQTSHWKMRQRFVIVGNMLVCRQYDENDEKLKDFEVFEVNYCPKCGRKLV